MILNDSETVFDQVLSAHSEIGFRRAVDQLFETYEILSLELGRGSTLWRARIIDGDIYQNLSDLDFPPPELAKAGRLNNLGSPCFYISQRMETALAEVGAKEGRLVQLAGFRINNEFPLRLAVIGEYANVQKNGYMHFAGDDPDMTIARILNAMPRQEANKHIYIDQFLASILADPNASGNGYLFSRALGQSIYSRIEAEGIVYPSVKDRGGFNIAVKAEPSDQSFENVSCLVVRIGKPRRFGLVEFTIVKSAERLDDDCNFIWREGVAPEIIGMYNLSKEELELAL